jgi:hypothetical protein
MPNQYSITLSDESAGILKRLNENGWKTSHAIDAAILMTAYDGWEMAISDAMRKAIRQQVGLK